MSKTEPVKKSISLMILQAKMVDEFFGTKVETSGTPYRQATHQRPDVMPHEVLRDQAERLGVLMLDFHCFFKAVSY